MRWLVAMAWLGAQSAYAQAPEPPSAVSEEPEAERAEENVEDAGEPARADRQARLHFELAGSYYEEGRFDEAYDAFAQAYALTGRAELRYNMFLCRRDSGRVEDAVVELERYLREAEDVPNRALLEGRLEALRARVEARAQERARADAATEEAAQVRRDALRPPSRVGPAILLASGGAALLAAGGLAIAVARQNGDLSDQCFDGRCPSYLDNEIAQRDRRALAVDATWISGLVLLGAGTLWWVVSSPRGGSDTTLACGPQGCTMRGTF